jgi:phosphoserine/homoserine phosphotransferase
MFIVCLDLEGILLPEIWISVAEKTGIEELFLTTRDIPDYDRLMRRRLEILKRAKITITDIQAIIQSMEPLDGAIEFLEWTREKFQLIVLSDTFVEFADPILKKLNRPTIFCNSLVIGPDGIIVDYRLRQKDGKKQAIKALKALDFRIIGIGDSYNDTTMLNEANEGILFRPPENIKREFPQFPVIETYEGLKAELARYLGKGD